MMDQQYCDALKELEAVKDERDALARDLEAERHHRSALEDSEQALAAHVEELRKSGNRLCYAGGDHSDWTRTLMQAPATSLARQKAEWQAEALEALWPRLVTKADQQITRHTMRELRRQTEELAE